jgi:O-antigen/teichoic acid export membrane protein
VNGGAGGRSWVGRLPATLGTSVAITVFGVISGVITARWLGPVGKGELALLLLWPQIISTLATLGVDLAVTYFSADPERRPNVPRTALATAVRQSAIGIAIYLALWPLVYRSTHVGALPLLIALVIPVDLAGLYLVHALNGRHDFRAFNWIRLTMPPAYAAAVGVLAAVGALSVTTAAVSFLCAYALVTLAALAYTRRRHGLGRNDRALRRQLTRFGLRAHLGRLSPQNLGVDVVVVSIVLATQNLGLFTAAIAFVGLGRMLAGSVGLVVFPQASAAHLAGEPPRVRGMIAITLAATALGALLLWLLATPLTVTLFGERFRPAADVARILALGEIARSAYGLLVEALRGSGCAGLTTVVQALDWVIFAGGAFVGAAAGGLKGVAVGLAVAATVSLAVLLLAAARRGALALLFGRPAIAFPVASGA